MKQIYKGKTKDVYQLQDGNYMLLFKDDATGANGVFDPGANQVGLSIKGKGKAGLRLSDYFFKKINEAGYNTHFISCDLEKAQMTVRPASLFGHSQGGIEVICRYKAYGSFIRRYGQYIEEGAPLPSLVEITIKDDERGDPPISRDSLVALEILDEDGHDALVELTRRISEVVKNECAEKGLELIDIKLEFGVDENGEFILIDEVSGDIMRVCNKDGKTLSPMELTEIMTV
jgi:phosphoribosylaminoimidazole-succinocarboxamide synthase